MPSVKGTYRNGVIHLEQPVSAQEGQEVVITFEEIQPDNSNSASDESWDAFMEFIDQNAIETGIPDLAHQHDHYIHGTPKREPYP